MAKAKSTKAKSTKSKSTKSPKIKGVSRVNATKRTGVGTDKMATKRDDTAAQREIQRLVRRTGNSGQFSGKGIRETVKPITVYNLEKNLTKAQLRQRVETMMGRALTKSEYRKLKATRVKSLDEKHKLSQTDRFGKDIRSMRTMEAWRITYS